MGSSNKGSEYFRNCEGISSSFSFSTPATEVVKGDSSQSKRKCVVTVEIGNILKKVAMEKTHIKKVSAKSQFVSNLSVVKKKDGGGSNRRGHYRFEESEPLHSRSPQKQQIQA